MKLARPYSPRSERTGAALVLFALLVFGLMGIAALVIDLGMASATQGQMQCAVDGASLEAMRWRNTTPDGTPDYLEPIPFLTEDHRRDNAALFLRLSFDDDLDPANGDVLGYGLGPSLTVSGGFGTADASALVSVDPVDILSDPPVQSNQSYVSGYNSPEGDMVTGTYSFDASHSEPGDYNRPDFAPSPHVTAASNADAFLVRLRRSTEVPVPGVSLGAPAIPYLFGRGSLIGAGADYSPRAEGISVRATAIATAQPALQVGILEPGKDAGNPGMRGAVPFAIESGLWNSIDVTINDPECVEVSTNGEILLDGTPIGSFVLPVTAIGESVVPVPPPSDPSMLPVPFEGWVPIYESISGTLRVVGFGYADLEAPDGCAPDQFSLSKRASAVASHNASAVFPQHTAQLTKAEWDAIFAARMNITEPLLAPAISR